MWKKTLKCSGAAALACGLFFASGWPFFRLTVRYKGHKKRSKRKWFSLSHTKINHPSYGFETEYEEGKAWCQRQHKRDCYIQSRDGLVLHGYYLPSEKPKRILLLSHGYKGSGFGDFANVARFLHENQCDLLFLDQRCCGESQGDNITFGALEQYDVAEWANYLAMRNVDHLPIYLYGESMGAAAVLMAAGHDLPEEVKGLIADCGFRSMKSQIQDMAASWFHMRWIGLTLFRLDLFCRVFAGFRMRDADTAGAMRVNKRPVLFFHGLMDTYVRPQNTLENYARCRAPKELVVIPEARHLCSAYVEPELYRGKLMDFFEKYDA